MPFQSVYIVFLQKSSVQCFYPLSQCAEMHCPYQSYCLDSRLERVTFHIIFKTYFDPFLYGNPQSSLNVKSGVCCLWICLLFLSSHNQMPFSSCGCLDLLPHTSTSLMLQSNSINDFLMLFQLLNWQLHRITRFVRFKNTGSCWNTLFKRNPLLTTFSHCRFQSLL